MRRFSIGTSVTKIRLRKLHSLLNEVGPKDIGRAQPVSVSSASISDAPRPSMPMCQIAKPVVVK